MRGIQSSFSLHSWRAGRLAIRFSIWGIFQTTCSGYNYRGWNKFQTVFSLLYKPHQIQQWFGPNRTFFRLHYTNLYTNCKCTTTQFYFFL